MKKKMALPDDFTVEGMNRGNNYLLVKDDWEDKQAYSRERFRRSALVMREFAKTPEYKEHIRQRMISSWEERAAAAKRSSDTTEVLLLEALTKREDGVTTSELVANCINLIAKTLAKKGVKEIGELSIKDLVLISNTLVGLMRTLSDVKRKENWRPAQTNIMVGIGTSKTGGVIGGVRDV